MIKSVKQVFSRFLHNANKQKVAFENKVTYLVTESKLISRDLSWLKFNYRVLEQANDPSKTVFDKLKFLAISASNLDEFFMIRVGSLYNYIDLNRPRLDNCGLEALPFKKKLFEELQMFFQDQYDIFNSTLVDELEEKKLRFLKIKDLNDREKEFVAEYFQKTIFPLLTPMLLDNYHIFPVLLNKLLYFGVVTKQMKSGSIENRLSFVQIPHNLSRFLEIDRQDGTTYLLPIEEIIRWKIDQLYRNVKIESVSLFRIVRNGDFAVEDGDEAESDADLIEDMRQNLKKRKTGRVVRVDIEKRHSSWMRKELKTRCIIDDDNFFEVNSLIDFNSLWQIIKMKKFKEFLFSPPAPVTPLMLQSQNQFDIFEYLKTNDLLLHHPYNSIDYLVEMLEKAAIDPNVLGIKITIYRLAKESRISNALYRAAENGKHVSVLFEVKARFDEEHNINEAQKLQKAGCFVIYGVGNLKTHCKLLMIIKKEDDNKIRRYVHLSSGNYNEETAKLYTDVSLLTSNEIYANDVSELFNVITGHSQPEHYDYLITAPNDMRKHLIELINNEIVNAKAGRNAAIVIKINSLQDNMFIEALYNASQAGVKILLIVRGICCLRPGRAGLSENIMVKSVVGNFLEHARIFYFQNSNDPVVYAGSADAMVRSFERRVECLYYVIDEKIKKEIINILKYNILDNKNSFILNEDGAYEKEVLGDGKMSFDLHKEFYKVQSSDVESVETLYDLL